LEARKTFIAVICLLAAATQFALAQDEARAVRLNGEQPVIDGELGDHVWGEAPALTEFLQQNPDEGAAPSESTEVRFLYSDRALYVGVRAYDREPDKIESRLVRRDQFTSADNLSVYIDSYYDRRSAFEFNILASGARRDVFIYDDGAGRDDSWDPVYDWATRRDSLGWSLEMRVPFSQLRFPAGDSLRFGLRVRRVINRKREELNWPFFPRDQAGEASRYGDLVGFVDLPAPRRVEFTPYTAGSLMFEPQEDGNPFATGRSATGRFGTDLKLGVTSGLTLDLSVNPDFGQVEADAAVVNLTAFETFFPEKRPFFVEGINLFRFDLSARRGGFGRGGGGGGRGGGGGAGGGGFFGGGLEGLVYSRRVGRRPQVSPDLDDGFAQSVNETTILGAAKLSGQLGGGWSVGLMQALTGKEKAQFVDGVGTSGYSPIEPLTNYTVVRAQRTANQGRLAYGAMATGVVRDLDEAVFVDNLRRRAFSGGADMRWRFGRDAYEVQAAVMGSQIEGSPEAILDAQENSSRYFQRPDQTHSTLDPTATMLRGYAANARVAKVVGFLTWEARYDTRSPGFEVNDMGFLRNADRHQLETEVELRWLRPGRVFRRFTWQFNEDAQFTHGGERTQLQFSSRLDATFLNYWGFNTRVERRLSSLETGMLRGGPAVEVPGAWEVNGRVRSNFTKPVWADLGFNHTREDVTGVTRSRVSGGVRLRRGPVSLSLTGNGSINTDDRQYVTTETTTDSTYYVVGRIDRKEVSLTLRADLAITPKLSFEFFAQPFVSAGRYETLKLVQDPKADIYAQRFDELGVDRMTRPGGEEDVAVDVDADGFDDIAFSDPDFRVVSLRSNAVLRWEFQPGSTLFLVWQQDRRDRFDDGDFDLGDSVGEVFGASGHHVLAVKVAYWLGL
jgi:hypothetical protein